MAVKWKRTRWIERVEKITFFRLIDETKIGTRTINTKNSGNVLTAKSELIFDDFTLKNV